MIGRSLFDSESINEMFDNRLAGNPAVRAVRAVLAIALALCLPLAPLQAETAIALSDNPDAVARFVRAPGAPRPGGEVELTDVDLLNNRANNGGALGVDSARVVVNGGEIQGNNAFYYGGGLYVIDSSGSEPSVVKIELTRFTGNTAGVSGGGAWADSGQTFELRRAWFQGNVAEGLWAGAAFNPTLVERCWFLENGGTGAVTNYAGAVKLRNSAIIRNSVFMGNVSYFGGAVDLYDYPDQSTRYELINNTFVDNTALSGEGMAIYFYAIDAVVLKNNIIVDTGLSPAESHIHNIDIFLSYDITHNDLWIDSGTAFGGYVLEDEDLIGTTGNIPVDPMFDTYHTGDFAGADLQLLPGSPCINAGDISYGGDRDGTETDMGAYGGPTSLP